MVVIEAMYVSHTLEPVEVPDADVVARFLPPYAPEIRLDPGDPHGFGGTSTPRQWRATRLAMQAAMERAREEVAAAGHLWGALTGRAHGALDTYRAEDAELVLIAMGSIAGTAREAVDRLRDDGVAAGLVRVRLFRPFPGAEIVSAVAGADRVAVIDRNCSIGSGGIVGTEVRAALAAHGETDAPVFSYVAGLGGVDVPVARIVAVARDALRRTQPAPAPILEESL
jgi:pyruvate/2-oxoacid:ferredoxin oxidoreductase alpha subunit